MNGVLPIDLPRRRVEETTVFDSHLNCQGHAAIVVFQRNYKTVRQRLLSKSRKSITVGRRTVRRDESRKRRLVLFPVNVNHPRTTTAKQVQKKAVSFKNNYHARAVRTKRQSAHGGSLKTGRDRTNYRFKWSTLWFPFGFSSDDEFMPPGSNCVNAELYKTDRT